MPLSMNDLSRKNILPLIRLPGLKLFGRIFLCFWTTVLLVLIVAVFVTYFLQVGPFNRRIYQVEKDFIRSRGQMLVEIYDHLDPGKVGLLGQVFGSRFFWLFSLKGEILLKSQRPPNWPTPEHEKLDRSDEMANLEGQIASAVPNFALKKEDEEVLIFNDHEFLFQKVIVESGNTYIVVNGMPPMRSLLRFLENPSILPILTGFFFITGIFCWWLAHSMAAPVIGIREMSRRFAGGDLQARISAELTDRFDEFGDLAKDFNDMASKIESMMKRQKSLLHDISHELRSPLARMQVALELARKKKNEDNQGLLDRIGLEADRLEKMLQEVLTLFRLEDDKMTREKETIDLGELVEAIIADARFEANQNSERITWRQHSQDPVKVSVVANAVGRAIENVIRNALKYSPSQSVIEVVLTETERSDGGTATVLVSDRGPGIPEEKLPHLFEPFFRCEEDRSSSSGGVGLGLAITRRSIEMNGGRVTARNRDNGGLTVELSLPRVN